MCDTMVALRDATFDGSVIFGKNSDRYLNESQLIRVCPRENHPAGSKVKCTYIEVPQARETFAVVLSSPWWLWGGEMGVNEYGVVIGNEAVWSKEPVQKTGLLGMDLLRLGLERGETAYDAMRVIIEHLEEYGQGGSCRYGGESYYDNSFLICDRKEAWVLETAGRYWVAKRIRKGVKAISNVYTIEEDYDEAHPELVKHALEKGWCPSIEAFNFARCYWDLTRFNPAVCQNRLNRSTMLLEAKKGEITLEYMMSILRDHFEGTALEPRWTPNETFWPCLCVHATYGLRGETAGSMVAHLKDDIPTVWLTGASLPCINMFKPIYPLGNITPPKECSTGTNKYSEDSAWWIFEKTNRLVNLNYAVFAPLVTAVWRQEEKRIIHRSKHVEKVAYDLMKRGQKEKAIRILQEFVSETWSSALKKAKELEEILVKLRTITPIHPSIYQELWDQVNEEANIKL